MDSHRVIEPARVSICSAGLPSPATDSAIRDGLGFTPEDVVDPQPVVALPVAEPARDIFARDGSPGRLHVLCPVAMSPERVESLEVVGIHTAFREALG